MDETTTGPRFEIQVIMNGSSPMWQIFDNELKVVRARPSYDTTRITRQCAALNRACK